MPVEWPRYARYLCLSLLLVALDQASKHAVLQWVGPGRYLPIIGSTFGIRLVENRGVAFSLFASAGPLLIRSPWWPSPPFSIMPAGPRAFIPGCCSPSHCNSGALSATARSHSLWLRRRFHLFQFLAHVQRRRHRHHSRGRTLAYCLPVSPDPTRTESS